MRASVSAKVVSHQFFVAELVKSFVIEFFVAELVKSFVFEFFVAELVKSCVIRLGLFSVTESLDDFRYISF
jgi:hypothetical protein